MIKKIYELNDYLLITAIFIISNHEKKVGFFLFKKIETWLIYKFSYYLIWTECNVDQMRGDIELIVHLEQMLGMSEIYKNFHCKITLMNNILECSSIK